MPNRLALETSPYLLQHAENPVEWYPWGDEAFARARAEERPILLSVGYSSCHWCHVMAHESFEDPSIAALMNEGFVNIKVDREERPDVDAVYMAATQAMSGQGGWPMTVFLTPSGEPFFAGTYFPPDDRYGRPGFPSVLEAVRKAWEGDRARVVESAQTVTERLREATARASEARGTSVDASILEGTVGSLRRVYDGFWGGFGRAPKFPNPSVIEFLLGRHALGGGRAASGEGGRGALEMATHTLRRMAQGGIYDHLGGGFARYSTDERWLVPHFEKMLYDNAQLARVYLHASLVAEAPGDRAHFEGVARETLDYLVREMRDAGGGFHSAQDADSEGIEGKFFVWTPEEIDAAVAPEDAALVRAYYGVTPHGNFEDPHHPEFGRRTVLSTPRGAGEVAAELGIEEGALLERLPALRARLLEVREQRVRPGLDDKVLASWNGLALSAFAEAGRVLGDARYLDVAREVAAFLERDMWRDGRLLHSYRAGVAKIDGMLEDYAYVGRGLVDLYRATGDLERLRWAGALLGVLIERFRDEASGGFFDTPDDGEALLVRQRSTFDGPTPSGNAAAAHLAAWLGRYFDRHEWEDVARAVVAAAGDAPAQYPSAFGALLQVLELLTAERRELAIVGAPEARAPLEGEAAARHLPTLVLAPSNGGGGLPLLEGREAASGAAAYVCRDMVCDLPVSDVEGLRAQLDALGALEGG